MVCGSGLCARPCAAARLDHGEGHGRDGAEYGGGGGAIINMVTHTGTNEFHGGLYSYYRNDRFNSRNAFLPASAAKPKESTLQTGINVGGPIIKNRIHFFSTFERDHEKSTGYKVFPAAAAPLAVNQFGTFEVRAENVFNRIDVELNSNHVLSYFKQVVATSPGAAEATQADAFIKAIEKSRQ